MMSDFLATIIILLNRWTAVEMAMKYDRVGRQNVQIIKKLIFIYLNNSNLILTALEETDASICANSIWHSHLIIRTSTHN